MRTLLGLCALIIAGCSNEDSAVTAIPPSQTSSPASITNDPEAKRLVAFFSDSKHGGFQFTRKGDELIGRLPEGVAILTVDETGKSFLGHTLLTAESGVTDEQLTRGVLAQMEFFEPFFNNPRAAYSQWYDELKKDALGYTYCEDKSIGWRTIKNNGMTAIILTIKPK